MRGCTGKVRFDYRSEAVWAKRALRRPQGERARSLHVYFCTHCSGWHLTSWNRSRAEVEAEHE